jgi:hypothetical protein
MNESKLFREVRMEIRREDLISVLRTKLTGDALATALARVQKQDDFDTLSRWFDLSLTLSPEALLAELDR